MKLKWIFTFASLLLLLAPLPPPSSGSWLIKKKCRPYYDVHVHTVYETSYDHRCTVHYDKQCETLYDTQYETKYEKECHTTYYPKCTTIYFTTYVKKWVYKIL